MKKTFLLNIKISELIASLGHGNSLVISDAGLPIPPGVPLIDLALTRGVPNFRIVLEAVLSEMCVESHILSSELLLNNQDYVQGMDDLILPNRRNVPHGDFKRMTGDARAIIRTGECTPYANIILFSGVFF